MVRNRTVLFRHLQTHLRLLRLVTTSKEATPWNIIVSFSQSICMHFVTTFCGITSSTTAHDFQGEKSVLLVFIVPELDNFMNNK